MKILFLRYLILLLIVLLPFVMMPIPQVYAVTTSVGLGTSGNFAVLGASAINDTNPPSTIIGHVGLSPTTGAAIGITAAEVTGTIYAVNNAGPAGSVNNPGLLTTARADLSTAYTDAFGRTPTTTYTPIHDLGGATLTSGVYNDPSSLAITGTLTLDAGGDANAIWIFQAGSTLTTAASSKVVLTNGAQACNVFWQIGSSATLGTSTTFVGNILAFTSITDNGSSNVNGRLLAASTTDTTGAVTLNHTTVTKSTCAPGTIGGGALLASSGGGALLASSAGSSGGTSNSSTGPILVPPCVADPITTAPIIITSKRISPTSIFINWGPFTGINTFNVHYGLTNGNWLYNTNVTGFSTIINDLPPNQPIWIEVAARNNCAIGNYGGSRFVGGPSLPNAGLEPSWHIASWSAESFLLKLTRI